MCAIVSGKHTQAATCRAAAGEETLPACTDDDAYNRAAIEDLLARHLFARMNGERRFTWRTIRKAFLAWRTSGTLKPVLAMDAMAQTGV